MYYPQELSQQARARIQVEELNAKKDLGQAREQVGRRQYGPGEELEKHFRAYILRIFRVCGRQLCELGSQGGLPAERIRSEALEFLRRLTIEAFYGQGHDSAGGKLHSPVGDGGALRSEIVRKFEKSIQWYQFEEDLLAVALLQSDGRAQDGAKLSVIGSLPYNAILRVEAALQSCAERVAPAAGDGDDDAAALTLLRDIVTELHRVVWNACLDASSSVETQRLVLRSEVPKLIHHLFAGSPWTHGQISSILTEITDHLVVELQKSGADRSDAVRGLADGDLPSLALQEAFETARAQADLEFLNSANLIASSPVLAMLAEQARAQKVFFAYCTGGLAAYRQRLWTRKQVRQNVERAWPDIFGSYYDRDHPRASDEKKYQGECDGWKLIEVDSRWKQYLGELAEPAPEDSVENVPQKEFDAGNSGQYDGAASSTLCGAAPSSALGSVEIEPSDLELMPKSQRDEVRLNAAYARQRKYWPAAIPLENLLTDSQAWAKDEIRRIAPEVKTAEELKSRVVKRTYDEFFRPAWERISAEKRFPYLEFESALWLEGWPSVEDVASEYQEDADPGVTGAESIQSADELSGGEGQAGAVAANWEDVQIIFIGDHRVQIEIPGRRETRNYHELGFVDRRSDKPNEQWAILQLLARNEGTIADSAVGASEWMNIQKRIERTRKALQNHFGLIGDPIPYIDGSGYRARFKTRRSVSADI